MPALRHYLRDLGKRTVGQVSAGLHRLLGGRADGAFGILVYHRIAPRSAGVPEPTMNVTPRQFRAQLLGLLRRGFHYWPLRRVLDHHFQGKTIPPRTVVVTFDDGFGNVFTRAWPIMRELHIPATIFVSTAYLDSVTPFPFDRWGLDQRQEVAVEAYRPLTTVECLTMVADGLVDLGAHTHTHRDLRGRPDDFRQDVQASVEVLRRLLGREEVPFAFPFGRRHTGHAGDDLLAAARQSGVSCGLTTEAELVDPRSDPFGWGRFNVYDWDNAATLAARLEGWYSWGPRLQQWPCRGGHTP